MDNSKINLNILANYSQVNVEQTPLTGAKGTRTFVQKKSDSVSRNEIKTGFSNALEFGKAEKGEMQADRDVKQVGGGFLDDAVVLEKDFFEGSLIRSIFASDTSCRFLL